MTAPRMARGSKGRLILYFTCGVAFLGLMAIYHNTLTQLDAVKKANDICQQHQDSLNAQLQVIFDYKTRLEKTVKEEKAGHKQTRLELQKRFENEREKNEKNTIESNLKYSSLQQRLKTLQGQYDELEKKSSHDLQNLRGEIDGMTNKLKSLENIQHQFESLKSQYTSLMNDKEKLEGLADESRGLRERNESEINRLLKSNYQLQKENDRLKMSCASNNYPVPDGVSSTIFTNEPKTVSNRTFSRQVAITEGKYQINDATGKAINIEINPNKNLIKVSSPLKENNLDLKDDNKQVLPEPDLDLNGGGVGGNGGVNMKKFSSSTSSTKTGPNSMDAIKPIVSPKPTTQQPNKDSIDNSGNVLLPPNLNQDTRNKNRKQLPAGVVPIPENIGEQPLLSEDNQIMNLRRSNDENGKPLKKPKTVLNEANFDAVADPINPENGAMEVIDSPNGKNAQDDALSMIDAQNDAFGLSNQNANKPLMKHIDTLNLGRGAAQPGLRPGGMNYEAEGDYPDKADKADLQLEEAEPEGEEDDDTDDYNGHIVAREKDPAVRN